MYRLAFLLCPPLLFLAAIVTVSAVTAQTQETVEGRLIASWRAHFVTPAGPFTSTFRPQPDGSFKTLIVGANGEMLESGRVRAADGKWQVQKSNGQTDGGSYIFEDSNTVTFKGFGPPITWVRVPDIENMAQRGTQMPPNQMPGNQYPPNPSNPNLSNGGGHSEWGGTRGLPPRPWEENADLRMYDQPPVDNRSPQQMYPNQMPPNQMPPNWVRPNSMQGGMPQQQQPQRIPVRR